MLLFLYPTHLQRQVFGKVCPPHHPSGQTEMPHSSTQRCSASAKGARTEVCYLSRLRGYDLTRPWQSAHRQRLIAAASLLFWTAKSFQTAGAAGLAIPSVWMQHHGHKACVLAPFYVLPEPKGRCRAEEYKGVQSLSPGAQSALLSPLSPLCPTFPDAPFPVAAPGA